MVSKSYFINQFNRIRYKIVLFITDKNYDTLSNRVKTYEQHMEIVSLVGTLSSVGGHHLHISLSDKEGNLVGGHVFGELNVFTTAEVVIGECENYVFDREDDPESGFKELVVKSK
jgi:predicted DNA-binding protein with PD1-like motif